MGTYFKNEHGQEVGLCPKCNTIKPKSHLVRHSQDERWFHFCYECNRRKNREQQAIGDRIRQSIFLKAGGCVWPGCHMRYPQDLRGNFCLDHINPELKLHKHETQSMWIASNQEEFWSRVAPNLQVLCVHHNLEKMANEYTVGGIMHVEPWDGDDDDIPHIDFNEIKLVLPGFEEYANPLT